MIHQKILTTSLLQSYPCTLVTGFYMLRVYKKLTADVKSLVINFWLSQKAIIDPNEANRRVDEVVFIICDKQWNIIGINSAAIAQLNYEGNYYYFRMYISSQFRGSYLAPFLINHARDYLLSRTKTDKTNGFIVVTENKKMSKPGLIRWYKKNDYNYLGKDNKGCDVWLATHN